MKRGITFLIVLCSIQSFGQYKQLAIDSASWYLKHEVWDGAVIEHLYLQDTVTKNSKVYYEVAIEGIAGVEGVIGYFREDTSAGKAWFWGIADVTEYLIMDLSLSVGDSFYVKMFGYPEIYALVTNTDVVNGKKTLTLDYHYGGGFISEELKFIDGVGPSASFLYQVYDETPYEIYALFGYLVCTQYQGSTLVYAWDTATFECGPLFDGIAQPATSVLSFFYPNPATEVIYVNMPGIETTLFNAMGLEIVRTESQTIPIAHLPIGMYYAHAKRNGKLLARTKLLVQ